MVIKAILEGFELNGKAQVNIWDAHPDEIMPHAEMDCEICEKINNES